MASIKNVKAHVFDLSDIDPLKCHNNDCVLNVLHYLKIFEKDKAFKLANVTNDITVPDLLDFLNTIYSTPHDVLELYNTDEDPEPSPYMIQEMLEIQDVKNKLEKLLPTNSVAFGIFIGKVNHLALFANIEDDIFIVDPQRNLTINIDEPDVGYYLYQFDRFAIVTSPKRKPKVRNMNTLFEKKIFMNTIKHRIRKQYNFPTKTATNTMSNTLKWSRYKLQHRDLKPLKKYKIIKKPNKEIRDSVFLRFEENNAVFEDITVPTSEHFFIELPKSPIRRKSFNNFKKSKSKSKKSRKSRKSRKSKHSI